MRLVASGMSTMDAGLEANKRKHKRKHKMSVTRRMGSGIGTMTSVTSRMTHLTLANALLKVASGFRTS